MQDRAEFRGPSTPTEVEKIEYKAIDVIECIRHSGVSAPSHSLSLEPSPSQWRGSNRSRKAAMQRQRTWAMTLECDL